MLYAISNNMNRNMILIEYTVWSKVSRTEFFTTFLPMPSTRLWLNYVVKTVSHKSANWR